MRRYFLCMFVIFLSAGAWAVGKQTVDPNQGNSTVTAAVELDDSVPVWQADSRLDKTVRYYAQRAMVWQILADLEKISGVTLFAGRSTTDWRTRELRMNVAAMDLPLKDLMQSIARVLRLRWVRAKTDQKYTYRLIGEKPQETPEEKAARELRSRRQTFFTHYIALADMSRSQLDRLQTTNPDLAALSKTPLAMPFAKLLAQAPAASMAMVEGKGLRLRGNDVPLSVATELATGLIVAAAPVGHTGQPEALPHLSIRLDAIVVDINPSASTTDSGTLGSVEVSCGGTTARLAFADPRSAERAASSASSGSDATAEAKIEPDTIVKHPDGPDLHKKIKLDIKESQATWGELQIAFAEASGLAVISDCFEEPYATHEVPRGEIQLKDCLTALTLTVRNWEKRGPIIEIRDREWARKRKLMTPEKKG